MSPFKPIPSQRKNYLDEYSIYRGQKEGIYSTEEEEVIRAVISSCGIISKCHEYFTLYWY